ncbi:MAG: GNAT family N-acetyltransferase [Candidatus Pacebacteria bacterium]|jgi:arginyl-tRNA--protein-N-Asp/Glu arginylyltransferase|nr:GNAT family N-acetyltransferase [Candidatus Paceibacterota bacterium]
MPRIFLSEYVHSYDTYTFGYTLYAERLNGESLDMIWEQGFLTYTGKWRSECSNMFYMTRSTRVDLSRFTPSSENRRIRRKLEQMSLTVTEYIAANFAENDAMMDFCLSNFKAAHAMPKERLKRVLLWAPETKVIEYKDGEGNPRAYIIEIRGGYSSHHYYDFYDQSLGHLSFGAWLMLDRIEAAKARGETKYYLGTLYGEGALYKANYQPLEFWTGNKWSSDIVALKQLARNDAHKVDGALDLFKEGTDL